MEFKFLKELFGAVAFTISTIILLIYAIFFHNDILINETNLDNIFTLFLAFFPLIIAIFTILISFIDNNFLIFLKQVKTKDKKNSIYDEIIHYFIMNTILTLTSVLVAGFILCFKLYNLVSLQYFMIFLFTYTIISFMQIIRFIFYFAKKKADFVNTIENKKIN